MKLKKIEINKEGEIETVWVLTPDQYYFLVHYACNDLLQRGIAQTENITEAELKQMQQDALKDAQNDFLANVDAAALAQA